MDNRKLKVVILTGNERRHLYFASEISQHLNVILVAFEKKANVHEQKDFGNEGNYILAEHFGERSLYEQKYFDQLPKSYFQNVLELKTGKVNDASFVQRLIDENPDYVISFGSSLIGEPILNAFPNRVVNLHLGLSPYYRGSGTLFWPLVDGLPEFIGSTVHLAVKKIDAGGILAQVRPEISLEDTVHDLGNKTIIASTKLIASIIEDYDQGKRKPIFLDMSQGKLCLRKHLEPKAIKKMYSNFRNGMIADYLEQLSNRIRNYPIVE